MQSAVNGAIRIQQAVPSLPAVCGGRKVRAAQGIMLPNGKISARVWLVEQKITAPDCRGKGEKVR